MGKQIRVRRCGKEVMVDVAIVRWRKKRKLLGLYKPARPKLTTEEKLLSVFGDEPEKKKR